MRPDFWPVCCGYNGLFHFHGSGVSFCTAVPSAPVWSDIASAGFAAQSCDIFCVRDDRRWSGGIRVWEIDARLRINSFCIAFHFS
jgi:hypothetical protein